MGLSKGREIGSLLMHASIPITHAFLWFLRFPFHFPPFLPCSTSISFSGDDTFFFSDEPLLFTATILYIVCDDGIFHFFTLQLLLAPYRCPSKTTYWPVNCPATIIVLNVLAAPLLIPRQNGLSCFLPSSVLTTLIWIRINPLSHLPLWYASSGLSSFLLFLGEIPS